MSKNLVIVESPAKAKTIEKYLGADFTVLSSVGHIRSIVKKTKDGTPPIDVENDFKTTYEIDAEKKKVVAALRKAAKAADTIYLATDPDREGEAIAWHLAEVLKLDPGTAKRMTYHEISKPAVERALREAHTIDMDMVRAQQARQILDRIVGFELSPVVWQKVPGGKSAGRVQSPAVRLLVEREREIREFEGSSQFKVMAVFVAHGEEFKAELKTRFDSEAEAHDFLASLKGARFVISNVTKSPGTRNPSAPFTTSTLQQEANAKLGMGSKATMGAAQKLYQAGRITYMRTDSVNLSGQAIASATDYIKQLYGVDYSQVRKYKTKNASAQEAHEAIRPTDITREEVSGPEQKLYDLIRRRTLASQMASAKIEKTTVTIDVVRTEQVAQGEAGLSDHEDSDFPSGARQERQLNQIAPSGSEEADKSASTQETTNLVFEAKGEVVVFDGFLRVYGGGKDELLPKVTSGDDLRASSVEARQVFARPPARYTEGSLVKKLEDLGIGRPSTYATIIDTVQTRGYVERGDGEGEERDVVVLELLDGEINREIAREKTGSTKGKLVPTPSGELIADFLTEHFTQVVDYNFTADVEKHFDDISSAKLDRNKMLRDFYTPFHKLIEQSGGIDRSNVGANREVGIDPKSGKPILARFGRFGPMLQLGATEDKDDKPQFAPLPRGARIETVTLEQALEAFKLPRLLGETKDGLAVRANVGRFGPFIQIGTKTKTTKPLYVSLKHDDPHDITLERALELYAEKLAAEAAKNIADFGDGIRIIDGRFGPYITDGTKNAKVAKDTDPRAITHDEAKKLLADAPARKGRARRSGVKSAAKKPSRRSTSK